MPSGPDCSRTAVPADSHPASIHSIRTKMDIAHVSELSGMDPGSAPSGALLPADHERMLRLSRWRQRIAFLTLCVDLVLVGAALCVLALLLFLVVPAVPNLLNPPAPGRNAATSVMLLFMLWSAAYLTLLLYALLFLLPFVLTLPISAAVIGLWSEPPRFLLLRPFNRGRLNRPLRRIVRRTIGPLGHVYTLSDADIRVAWYVRIPLLLGQVALFSFRARRIRTPRQLARLEGMLNRTWLRNVNWCLSHSKAFPITTDDACWQAVVRTLAQSVDAIVIDATELRPNVMWEVELCRALNRGHRVIFLVNEKTRARALAQLREAAPDLVAEEHVFVYSDRAVDQPERLQRVLAGLAAAGVAERRGGARPRTAGRLGHAAVALFSVQILPALGLSLFGFGVFPRWTPWLRDHDSWPGLATVVNPAAGAIVVIGLGALVLLLVSARRQPTLYFLAVVQALALLASPIGMLGF